MIYQIRRWPLSWKKKFSNGRRSPDRAGHRRAGQYQQQGQDRGRRASSSPPSFSFGIPCPAFRLLFFSICARPLSSSGRLPPVSSSSIRRGNHFSHRGLEPVKESLATYSFLRGQNIMCHNSVFLLFKYYFSCGAVTLVTRPNVYSTCNNELPGALPKNLKLHIMA